MNTFELRGRIPTSVRGEVIITFAEGDSVEMTHLRECCEQVNLQETIGDTSLLIGEPLTIAEDDHPDDPEWYKESYDSSHTWTRFRLGNTKGTVEFWWLGESNGYYGEEVELVYNKP